MKKSKDQERKDEDMDREIKGAIECLWTIRERLTGAEPSSAK
jgi:hypothetical protein